MFFIKNSFISAKVVKALQYSSSIPDNECQTNWQGLHSIEDIYFLTNVYDRANHNVILFSYTSLAGVNYCEPHVLSWMHINVGKIIMSSGINNITTDSNTWDFSNLYQECLLKYLKFE